MMAWRFCTSRYHCFPLIFLSVCPIAFLIILSTNSVPVGVRNAAITISNIRLISGEDPHNGTDKIKTPDIHMASAITTGNISIRTCEIFCEGPLLEAAQNACIFNDSKTFVDLHLKNSTDVVLAAFDKLEDPSDPDVMRNFVDTYFDGPELGLIDWNPGDWKPRPAFLSKIKDYSLRIWAEDLHSLWKKLGRKIKTDVATNQDRYSLIYVDQPFIVPGGRFREFYYWDSYWMIRGLLISGMTKSVRGMLSNLVYLIDNLGFVPNGNRIYYADRSQPPYLTPSVKEYLKATDDYNFVKSILPALEQEYLFWMTNRSIEIKKPGKEKSHILNRYDVYTNNPRPESFREDTKTCSHCSEEESLRVYSNLASGAESGWDFSSRWLAGNRTELVSIKTKDIIPVDLNSVLCLNEKILSEFFKMAGQPTKAKEYMAAHIRRRQAIQEIFWVEETGAWLDFDLNTSQIRQGFYPSNIMPMWANCYGEGNGDVRIEEKVLQYLKKLHVLDYPGGVPTSLRNTGQQWDYPNAWPPLQEMTIQALASSSLSEGRDYAFKVAQNWTTTNWKAYQEKGVMFEKYDVEKQGAPGHGGEYQIQVGFGWTNGVMLILLEKYGDKLSPIALSPPQLYIPVLISLSVVVALLALVIVLHICNRKRHSTTIFADLPYTRLDSQKDNIRT